jgi:hypothetical protein
MVLSTVEYHRYMTVGVSSGIVKVCGMADWCADESLSLIGMRKLEELTKLRINKRGSS